MLSDTPKESESVKVLVTGAAGRVGANVVRRLAQTGAGVRAFVLPGDPHAIKFKALPDVEVFEGDLCDQSSVDDACVGVTHVVHLAAQMVLGNTAVDRFYDINALSTLRLLEAISKAGTGLERFIVASTDATFRPGDPSSLPLTEDSPQNPVNHYGTSKLLSEVIVRHRARELEIPYCIVRFGTVVSPEEADVLFRLSFLRGWVKTQQAIGKESTVWPLFDTTIDLGALIDSAAAGAPKDAAAALVGPSGPWRLSLIDVRDAALGVMRALTEPGAVGRALNIAAAEPISYLDAADAVAETYGVPRVIVHMPMDWRLEISIDAARQHIGYSPQHDYRSTLRAARDRADYIPADEGSDGVYAKLSGGAAG